jgi:hypothetical protein
MNMNTMTAAGRCYGSTPPVDGVAIAVSPSRSAPSLRIVSDEKSPASTSQWHYPAAAEPSSSSIGSSGPSAWSEDIMGISANFMAAIILLVTYARWVCIFEEYASWGPAAHACMVLQLLSLAAQTILFAIRSVKRFRRDYHLENRLGLGIVITGIAAAVPAAARYLGAATAVYRVTLSAGGWMEVGVIDIVGGVLAVLSCMITAWNGYRLSRKACNVALKVLCILVACVTVLVFSALLYIACKADVVKRAPPCP